MPAHDGLLRAVVTEAARIATDLRPLIRGLIAQANAAQHPQAPERTFTDRFGRPCPPRPHLNTAHDHAAPPELPASSLA